MKKAIIPFLFVLVLSFTSCIINNTKPEDCEVIKVTINKISEGSDYDIKFHDGKGKFYYINRGLEQGLNLEDLNTKVLNKTVTLHLAKVLAGASTSNHISQLAIDGEILFTEFELNN